MIIFTHCHELDRYLSYHRTKKHRIGFTPTMGALHEGHISLIDQAVSENDISVCSIFVNPTQFNESSDLEKYPRPIAKDIALLKAAGNHILFLPPVEEIYPQDLDPTPAVDLNGLDKRLEGKFRPGHFDGVIQVVHRLLDIVNPDHLYMGQKDYQQFKIIERMIEYLELPIKIICCPIAREANGLARSSRNERLSKKAREESSRIYEVLQTISQSYLQGDRLLARDTGRGTLSITPFELEYLEYIHPETLKIVETPDNEGTLVTCVAVWIDGIRLIDNVILSDKKV